MNIAIIIPNLAGGGAERVAQIVGDYYFTHGNNVYYFVFSKHQKQDYRVKGNVIYTNIESSMFDNTSLIGGLINLLFSSFEMRRLKSKYKIDTAISFMEACNYINVLSRKRERVITRVCTILSERDDLHGFIYNKKLVKFFYSLADNVIVMSKYSLKEMSDNYRVPRKKLVIIPNPINEFKNENKPNITWNYGEKVVICVGRLVSVKQMDRVIRAFSYVNQMDEHAKLIIIGKGKLHDYLRRLRKKYSLESSVIFTGFVSNISYYYKNARVFVMASKVEGFPNSMLEAMSYGLPVISTDSSGGGGEIIGKERTECIRKIAYCKYGIITPQIQGKVRVNSELSEQEIILGKAILEVLTNDVVHDYYQKKSFQRAKCFSIDRIMERYNRVIF